MIVPVLTIVEEAFGELNVFQPGASIPAPQSTLALSKLNQIIDNWNAERDKVWCEVFASFTLVPSLSPHTIGPSAATFTTVSRPVAIDGVSLNLNINTPNVFVPIARIDYQVYQALSVPGISTAIPTAVYYATDWPNGKLFFYPVPNFAYPVRFTYRTLFGVVTLADHLDMPPGYQEAITLTLSEAVAPSVGRAVPLQTATLAAKARARIEANNTLIPKLDLRDGQQERRGSYSNFNYISRQFT